MGKVGKPVLGWGQDPAIVPDANPGPRQPVAALYYSDLTTSLGGTDQVDPIGGSVALPMVTE